MNDFPMLGWVYDAEGFHGDAITIAGSKGLNNFMLLFVRAALIEKREVRITDRTGDEMLFHVVDGKIVWMGGTDEAARNNLEKLLKERVGIIYGDETGND